MNPEKTVKKRRRQVERNNKWSDLRCSNDALLPISSCHPGCSGLFYCPLLWIPSWLCICFAPQWIFGPDCSDIPREVILVMRFALVLVDHRIFPMGGACGSVPTVAGEGVEEPLPEDTEEQLSTGDGTLEFSGRKMSRLPNSICTLGEHLYKLYLSGTMLTELPDDLYQLHNLRTLAIDGNRLPELPEAVCSLPHLGRLYVGANRLQELPPSFAQLQTLRTLWIERNFLHHFPRVLLNMPALRCLQMGDNRLKGLPAEMAEAMPGLRGLWLYANRLERVPKVLLRLQGLEMLDLDRNRIAKFPDMRIMKGLRLLSYDHNPVTGPPAVGETVTVVGEGAQEMMEEREERRKQREEEEMEELERELEAAENNAGEGALEEGEDDQGEEQFEEEEEEEEEGNFNEGFYPEEEDEEYYQEDNGYYLEDEGYYPKGTDDYYFRRGY
uniref:Leucine rich repeat containing 10B n=1 Tax=Leptobrachium leishanense TaxID=445787 RepID=A0A8C5MR06_9ANUR